MSQTCFIRIVQGILGLTWDDAFRFANGVTAEEDRKERICEPEVTILVGESEVAIALAGMKPTPEGG